MSTTDLTPEITGTPAGESESADDHAARFTDQRRLVLLDGNDLYRQVDETWSALVADNDPVDPSVMVRGGGLVRMTGDGLRPWDEHSLRVKTTELVDYRKSTRAGIVQKMPTLDISKALINADSATYVGAPAVDSVVSAPVLSSTGELIVTPGYHAADRTYYRPAPALEGLTPRTGDLDVDDVLGARDFLLNDLLHDFDFADGSSRANALGLLLLPFLREFIGDSPTPLHAIMAQEPGSGKGWLAKATLAAGCGLVSETPEVAGDEMTKTITSILRRGQRAVVFDNIAETLKSGAMCAALTSAQWSSRILGVTEFEDMPNRTIWTATGNNMAMTHEVARRVVPVFLDPGDKPTAFERPKGSFRHVDLPGWALANRAKLVEAALILVQHWIEGEAKATPSGDFLRAEYRQPSERTLGSFERWADVVGGVLAAADVPGFLGNLDQLMIQADTEGQQLSVFFASWYGLAREPIKAHELAPLLGPMGVLNNDAPTELLDVHPARLPAKLPYFLRAHRGQRHGGYQLMAQDADRGGKLWWIRKLGS